MNTLSTFRLYLLRFTYLFITVGLTLMIWTKLIDPPQSLEHMRGVVWSMLGAVAILAAIGIRYPVQMLPVLLFELVWKSIWLVLIGWPLWNAHAFTAATASTWNDNVFGVAVCVIAIPWKYVYHNFVKKPSDRWVGARAQHTAEMSL